MGSFYRHDDEQAWCLARSIGLREWHTNLAIKIDFEMYFVMHEERLLAEARASPWFKLGA